MEGILNVTICAFLRHDIALAEQTDGKSLLE
jgi:hypothetical protein